MVFIANNDLLTLGMGQKDREKHLERRLGASQGGGAGRLAACLADGASVKGSRMKKTIARNDRMTLGTDKKGLKPLPVASLGGAWCRRWVWKWSSGRWPFRRRALRRQRPARASACQPGCARADGAGAARVGSAPEPRWDRFPFPHRLRQAWVSSCVKRWMRARTSAIESLASARS
jgi:hypothetical protein